MGASKVEQLDNWGPPPPGAKVYLKRLLRRARRRAERKDIENVPPRHTKGWYW